MALLAMAAATSAVGISLGAPASPALATDNYFCFGTVLAPYPQNGYQCWGDRHSLRKSDVYNAYNDTNFLDSASAFDSNGAQYGSWVYGYGHACHSYSGATLLYPWTYNTAGVGQTVAGVESYGADGVTC